MNQDSADPQNQGEATADSPAPDIDDSADSPAAPLLGEAHTAADLAEGGSKDEQTAAASSSTRRLEDLFQDKRCCSLTDSQAWMFGSFISLLSLLVFGTVYFHLAEEEWDFEDAWYFTVVTLTTVGYGVLTPSEGINQIVVTVFIILSVTAGSIAVGTITATFITSALESADKVILEGYDNKAKMRPGDAFAYAWKKLRDYRLVTLAFCVLFALIGTGFMCILEDWSFAEALYFAVVTMSTVGYGDMGPVREHRFAASIYILLSTAVFAFSISSLLASFVTRARRDSAREFMRGALTSDKLQMMDIDGDGEVSKDEFRVFMLTRLGFVEQETLDEIDAAFDLVDADRSGTLDKDDLIGVDLGDKLRDASAKKGK